MKFLLWYLRRSFTETFCLWLKPQSDDFSIELTQNSKIFSAFSPTPSLPTSPGHFSLVFCSPQARAPILLARSNFWGKETASLHTVFVPFASVRKRKRKRLLRRLLEPWIIRPLAADCPNSRWFLPIFVINLPSVNDINLTRAVVKV